MEMAIHTGSGRTRRLFLAGKHCDPMYGEGNSQLSLDDQGVFAIQTVQSPRGRFMPVVVLQLMTANPAIGICKLNHISVIMDSNFRAISV